MKADEDDSSDDSSEHSISDMVSFGGVLSTISAASSHEDPNDDTAGMDGLDIACRRVRFAEESLQHGQGKRHGMAKERLGVVINEILHDNSGSRSPPLRSGPPSGFAGIAAEHIFSGNTKRCYDYIRFCRC
jgi:hypothetical protein